MKFVLLFLLSFSLYASDDIARVETIVNDIVELRKEYAQSQSELRVCKEELQSQKKKSKDAIQNSINEEKEGYKKKILSLENEVKTLKNQIDNLENQIKSLKNKKVKPKVRVKEVVKEVVKKEVVQKIVKVKDNDNPFPNLLLKKDDKKIKTIQKPKSVQKTKATKSFKVTYFKPASFRLRKESAIYNRPNGKVIDQWEKKRSFTSNQKTQEWIKITGYFVDKKWRKAKKEMWVRLSDVKQR